MRIEKITEITAFVVETDEKEYCDYTRYGADNWVVRMGESNEPVYDCDELEKLFQEKIRNMCLECNKTSASAVASNDGVIKPCPFCGSEPIGPHAGDDDWWIECEKCKIVMDSHSKRDLIVRWNERAL